MTEQEIHILVSPGSGDENDETSVLISFDDEEANDIHYLMPAAEYLLYLAATKSSLGFEKAIELLISGAMTWRHKQHL